MFLTRYFLIASCLFSLLLNGNDKAIASDTVIVRYGFLKESVSLQELKDFSQTGKSSSKLDYFLKISKFSGR